MPGVPRAEFAGKLRRVKYLGRNAAADAPGWRLIFRREGARPAATTSPTSLGRLSFNLMVGFCSLRCYGSILST